MINNILLIPQNQQHMEHKTDSSPLSTEMKLIAIKIFNYKKIAKNKIRIYSTRM